MLQEEKEKIKISSNLIPLRENHLHFGVGPLHLCPLWAHVNFCVHMGWGLNSSAGGAKQGLGTHSRWVPRQGQLKRPALFPGAWSEQNPQLAPATGQSLAGCPGSSCLTAICIVTSSHLLKAVIRIFPVIALPDHLECYKTNAM
jgi:hypothetical protein